MAVYYVGLTGSDSNAGTINHPFATVAAANSVVQPGDTVYFLSGVYHNATYGALDASGNRDIWNKTDSVLKINDVHGTAEAPITYSPAPGAVVKLQYDGNGAVVVRGSSHIRIEGFDIEGPAATVTLQDALDAQWSYRVQTGTDAAGNPVYDYRERDPAVEFNETPSTVEKPLLFNASAISLPNGSTHIEIVGNSITGAAAHAIAAHGGNDYITVRGNLISDCTQLTSNGTHAVSFKSLDSSDTSDAAKIIVDGNTLIDNYNLLISWVPTKKFVTMAIDEGKPIHVQNCLATLDPVTGSIWDHGQVLIANNLVVRAGNAAITVNEARGVSIANNTIVDAGYINQLIDQDGVAGSPFAGFFSGQGLEPGFLVASGGLRLSGTHDVTVANNLISISDSRLVAVDAAADVTSATASFADNIFSGGNGLRFRADAATLSTGFHSVADPGFVDPAHGNYHITATSPAVDAGTTLGAVATDLAGVARVGATDVGAFSAPVADASGIAQLDAQGFLLDPSNPESGLVGTTIDGAPIWSATQTATHIARPSGNWTNVNGNDLTVTYTFDASQISGAGYAAFDAGYQAVARQVMDLYEQMTGLHFVQVAGTAAADISFQSIVGQFGGGGWAGFPTSGGVHVSIGYPWTAGDIHEGTYVFQTIIHELGHALGLDHPGPYNGSANHATQLDYWNDSGQYTVMSYYDANWTGGSFGQPSTPLLHDILALQMEYGANWLTRTGNTTYGYHNTTGLASYDLGYDSAMAFCIWDGGGIDTLDFSGTTADTVMDLRDGSFSSSGLRTYNVSIAYGVVMENAIGGVHTDRMRGNEVANSLDGGLDNDVIYGGSELPAVAIANPRDFIGVQLNQDVLTRNQYLAFAGVTAFSGAQFSFEEMVKISRFTGSWIEFASYNVSGNDNQFLVEGAADGNLQVKIANGVSYVSSIRTETLVDGQPHRLSLTWDKASGALNIYVDGQLKDSGTYAAGATIGSGGTLVIGQEQDTVGGGFDRKSVLQGTVGDIRIFNDARTDGEIDTSAFTPLVGNEQGLAHNWQVQAGDTTSVSDVVVRTPPVNTDMTIYNGATVVSTAPVIDTTPDNDTLTGGFGADKLFGGAGNDTLIGDGGIGAAPEAFDLVHTDVGDGARLRVNNVSLFPTNSFTIEFVWQQTERANEYYTVDFGSMSLYRYDSGEMSIMYWNAASNGWNYAAIPASSTDGQPHRISITYDDASGLSKVFVDGFVAWTKTFPPGTRGLSATGNIAFDDNANVGDVRIFNAALSDATIAANAFVGIANPAAQLVSAGGNLVQYWKADASGHLISQTGGTNFTSTGPTSTVQAEIVPASLDDTLNGGLGDDVLTGGGGTDIADWSQTAHDLAYTLSGPDGTFSQIETGTDTFTGIEGFMLGSGNDTLGGNAGNNVLDGGAGSDTALFTGSIADYTFTYDGTAQTVTATDHRVGANDGVDKLRNIETFQFANGTMTLAQIAAGAPTNVALSATSMAENTANGTLLGTLSTTDATAGDTFTYQLLDSGGGKFKLVGTTIVLEGVLNHEVAAFHDIVVRVTDAAGNTLDKTIRINVGNLDEATTGGITLAKASTGTTTFTATNTVADPDIVAPNAVATHWQTFAGGVWTDIAGATATSFTAGAAQVGKLLRASADFTDPASLGSTHHVIGTTQTAMIGDAAANALASALATSGAGTGPTILIGLGGNDTYQVGQASDQIIEVAGAAGGSDTVGSGLISIDLRTFTNVENGFVTGAGNLSVTGNAVDNFLYGDLSSGSNHLTGDLGNDTLTVGVGDTADGGVGTDTLRTRSALSLDLEATVSPGVLRYVGFERLQATGTTAASLSGTGGNDVLDGEASSGANHLYGRAGYDFYIVGAGDVVHEGAADGTDTIQSSTISLDLGSASFANVEIAQLAGTAALDLTAALTRSATLNGNSAHNVLTGGGLGDRLYGAGGQDDLYGGAGTDRFIFKAVTDSRASVGIDRIMDFAAGDKIDVAAVDPAGAGSAFVYHALGDATPVALGDMRQHVDVDGTTMVVDFYVTSAAVPSMTIKILNHSASMAANDFML